VAEGSKLAIYASIAGNIAIAATKFITGALTGSSAMLAEGIHSLVDACDGSLLLVGLHLSRKPPDDEHPFGYGRELYFWSLIVALIFFAVGGGVSVYEGVLRILRPEPLRNPTPAYIALAIALLIDGGSFLIGLRQFRREARGRGFWATVRESKNPPTFTVVLEDTGDLAGIACAFMGVWLSHKLAAPWIDGAASIAVGLVMAGVATVMIGESRSLLIGEAADPRITKLIRRCAAETPEVRRVDDVFTVHLGPHNIVAALHVEFDPELTSEDLAAAVDRLEARIRRDEPDVKRIYVEVEALRRVGTA